MPGISPEKEIKIVPAIRAIAKRPEKTAEIAITELATTIVITIVIAIIETITTGATVIIEIIATEIRIPEIALAAGWQ